MTGYGRSDDQNSDFILSIELKSVNSRFLDFSPRLPKILIPFEDDAYKIIKQKCQRGRLTLYAKFDYVCKTESRTSVNHDKLKEYINVLNDIQKYIGDNLSLSAIDLFKLPDVIVSENIKNEEEVKTFFLAVLDNAISQMQESRYFEGKNIYIDLNQRLTILKDSSERINTKSLENRDNNINLYKKKLQSLLEHVDIEESRLMQEIVILAEKRDITEELVRLNSHFKLFDKYLNSNNSEGKKINFLLQEIGREINTIASKTDQIEISHLVVDMKNELEKIREQVQNIV